MSAKAITERRKIDKEREEFFKISKELSEFYHALATLQTNLVMFARQNPDKLALEKLTEAVMEFCASVGPPPCTSGYVWDEGEQACVRVGAPLNE